MCKLCAVCSVNKLSLAECPFKRITLLICRASAYDVFAPSILAAASAAAANCGSAGAANNSSRRSSFRVPAPAETTAYNESSPSPEKNEAALFVEEDRRMRRRGSQL